MDAKTQLTEGLLEYVNPTQSEFWHHVQYETPEASWDGFVRTLHSQGFDVDIVWKETLNGNETFGGLKFKDDGQKLKFILKYSA